MEAIINQPFVPYSVLSPTIEPGDDLVLKFDLRTERNDRIAECPPQTLIIATCFDDGIEGQIQDPMLIWKTCGTPTYISVDDIADIVEADGKTLSVKFIVDDYLQAEMNEYEFQFEYNGELIKAARGKIYL